MDDIYHGEKIAALNDRIEFENYIASEGKSLQTESFRVRDPASGERITELRIADDSVVTTAVESSKSAFESTWGALSRSERSNRLLEWVEVLEEHEDELATIESLDTGKPISQAREEVREAIECLEYYAKVCVTVSGETVDDQSAHIYTRYEPFGLVGAIVPWNFPLVIASWKLGPALAAGNAVVIKPSEKAPLSITRAAQLSADVLPPGTINVVHGPGTPTGETLVSRPDVRKVSFTGSLETGKNVMRTAANTVSPVTLELGGKSPMVVFSDADMEKVVGAVAGSVFHNAGQTCDAYSRVLVHEDRHDEFVERLVARAEDLQVGDPLDPDTEIGPLIDGERHEAVQSHVDRAIESGATPARYPDETSLPSNYFPPTVLDEVATESRISQEEVFGPVEVITSFESYDQAIELANRTKYGLAAAVGTEDMELAHRAARDIDAGSVYINYSGPNPLGAPFGGYEQSGVGRELSRDAILDYMNEKSIYQPIRENY